MSDWISVKDRLPDTPGPKIVYAASCDPDKPMINMAWFEPEGTGNMPGWQLLPKVWCEAITHWMPLPEPPATARAATADQTRSAADPA